MHALSSASTCVKFGLLLPSVSTSIITGRRRVPDVRGEVRGLRVCRLVGPHEVVGHEQHAEPAAWRRHPS
jgi:hypothetical protein